jgi:hypothetical protein
VDHVPRAASKETVSTNRCEMRTCPADLAP